MIDPVDSVRRGALVREVLPAEEPAESAVKKCQCKRIPRSKERDKCAIRATAARGWPEVEQKTLRPESEEQLRNIGGLNECRRALSPKRHRSRAL